MRHTQYWDQFQALIDTINHDTPPEQRLAIIQQLYKNGLTLILQARDEAAYDLRCRYSSEDAAILAGTERKYIDYWANRWRKRRMLPQLKQKKRMDLSNVIDLSGK